MGWLLEGGLGEHSVCCVNTGPCVCVPRTHIRSQACNLHSQHGIRTEESQGSCCESGCGIYSLLPRGSRTQAHVVRPRTSLLIEPFLRVLSLKRLLLYLKLPEGLHGAPEPCCSLMPSLKGTRLIH